MIYARRAFQEEDHKEFWTEFNSLIVDIRKANELRNTYVHSSWLAGRSPEMPIRSVFDIRGGKLTIVEEPTPITELESVAEQIHEAGETFIRFLQKFGLLQS